MSTPAYRIGIDLGGTKIEGLLLESAGQERDRHRVATPRNDYDGTIKAIRALVLRLEAGTREFASVGIGMPGSLSPVTGLVQNSNSIWVMQWNH